MNRIRSIDILRALAIIGMVFSGQIAWTRELSPFMHHGQTPPPDFAFDPTISGITWVDLVFPFFLFTMGAAIPLAMRRKISEGTKNGTLFLEIVKRTFYLVFFAIVLGNINPYATTQACGTVPGSLIVLATWALLFGMFARFPGMEPKKNDLLNYALTLFTAGWLLVYSVITGIGFSLYKSDIIILILANMALFGSLIWWGTKDKVTARLILVLLLAIFSVSGQAAESWTGIIYKWTPAGWLYNADYLKYLCILLPGTIAGDLIFRQYSVENPTTAPIRGTGLVALLAGMIVVVNIWGLYTRHTGINFITTAALSLPLVYFSKIDGNIKSGTVMAGLVRLGIVFLLLGLVAEPLQGGIKKDPATVGYLFATTGVASLTLAVLTILCDSLKLNMNYLARCGQNPMIAYTAAGYFILPVAAICGMAPLLDKLSVAGGWAGVAKGVIITALTTLAAWGFARIRIYWKT